MPDSLMYQEEMFVLLEPGEPEQFLDAEELEAKLSEVLREHQADLPHDLARYDQIDQQVKHLINTSCEFETEPGHYLQWYVVRLEK